MMKQLLTRVLGSSLNVLAYVSPRTAGRLGFKLFCFPFRSPIKKFHHKFLSSAEQYFFPFEDTNIKVYKWGSGEKKVLFLHGWQSHTYRWKNYIQEFSLEEYTVYSIDAPGHGLSTGSFLTLPLYSDAVERFLHSINGADAIVSHSLGAFTTVYTLYRLPLLPVKKVVLLAPPGEASEFIEFYKSTMKLSDRSIKLICSHFELVIQEPPHFFSAPVFASGLMQNGLIIHDEEDAETSTAHSKAINKVWKKSKLIITKGLGHNLKSPLIVKEVLSFVTQESNDHVTAQEEYR